LMRRTGKGVQEAQFRNRPTEMHDVGTGSFLPDMGLAWRARTALVKGWGLLALGLWVIGSTARHAYAGTLHEAEIMGVLALVANVGVALMLYRFRTGDSNMRSVWICSRNDAIGNLAVIAAAAGVFGTGTGWPDLIVATVMASLSISGGWQIVRQARGEIRSTRTLVSTHS
jgi:Co/Zn/Cd efflux system component